MNIEEFKKIYSNQWKINDVCPNCKTIIFQPLKTFTDSFINLGITGDKKLTDVCNEYQDIEQKLWKIKNKHNFEFVESEE